MPGSAGIVVERLLRKLSPNAITTPSPNSEASGSRAPRRVGSLGSRTISSGTCASGKVRRSWVIHWRWTRDIRQKVARKTPKAKEDQAARGTSHSPQGTGARPWKKSSAAERLVGDHQVGT